MLCCVIFCSAKSLTAYYSVLRAKCMSKTPGDMFSSTTQSPPHHYSHTQHCVMSGCWQCYRRSFTAGCSHKTIHQGHLPQFVYRRSINCELLESIQQGHLPQVVNGSGVVKLFTRLIVVLSCVMLIWPSLLPLTTML